MKAVRWVSVRETLHRVGPYVLVELLLPGGTLLALLLWLSNGVGRGQLASLHQPEISPPVVERVVDVPPSTSKSPGRRLSSPRREDAGLAGYIDRSSHLRRR